MKKIRINFEKFSDGILIPQFPWPNDSMTYSNFIVFSYSQFLILINEHNFVMPLQERPNSMWM